MNSVEESGEAPAPGPSLRAAVLAGAADEVGRLLAADPTLATALDGSGQGPAHLGLGDAAAGVVVPTLRRLLALAPEVAALRNASGRLPLHLAAAGGNVEVVRLLMEAYPAACVQPCARQRRLPLHEAALHGQLRAAGLLLQRLPIAARQLDADGEAPLAVAAGAAWVRPKLVKLLLAAWPEAARVVNRRQRYALHEAAASGQLFDVMEPILRAHPAAALAQDKHGDVPLVLYLRHVNCRRKVIQLLLEAAPSAAAVPGRSGATALHLAAQGCKLKAAELLLAAAPQAAGIADTEGRLPLHLITANAGCRGSAELVRLLLAAHPAAAAVACPINGKTPLHLAAFCGREAVVRQLLVAAPQAAPMVDMEGHTPLHTALVYAKAAAAALLLEAAPATAATVVLHDGRTVLHAVAQLRAPQLAQLVLLEAPALVTWPCSAGWLPLHYAAERDCVEVARLLLEAAPSTAKMAGPQGRIPMSLAAAKGAAGIVKAMLEACPDCAVIPTDHGCSPLSLAAEYCNDAQGVEAVRLLLEAAPQMCTVVDNDGDSPLHCAALNGYPPVVELLMAAAPQMAQVHNYRGHLPLAQAIDGNVGLWTGNAYHHPAHPFRRAAERVQAARTLLAAGPPQAVLPVLAAAGRLAEPLFEDAVRMWRLGPDEWAAVPAPCPILAPALPAVLGRLDLEGAAEVVRRLDEADRQRLRSFARCLAASQRAAGVVLPQMAMWQALAAFSSTC